MTFFNFIPGSEDQGDKLEISNKFWIYWAVTAPITIILLVAWLLWQLAASRKAKQPRLEAGLGMRHATTQSSQFPYAKL